MKKSSIIILSLLFISAIWTTGEFNIEKLNQIVITFIIYFALFKILMRVLRSL